MDPSDHECSQPPSPHVQHRRGDPWNSHKEDMHFSAASNSTIAASAFGLRGTPAASPGQFARHGGLPLPNGLDLSFGYNATQFEKINLIGSGLQESAISSLVLSAQNITHLDLRGNGLNAAFGWRLVKAMKKRYLQLETCNGVQMRALRDNALDVLNLADFSGHMGLYGIEVVGAIFLAHFLRLNSSLTHLNFRRNDVQKDGAKALAQSLLGNPTCALRTVNGMGPPLCPGPDRGGRPGIDFAQFHTKELQKVHLSKRLLDDDDFVFLEEWLRRYDCVTELDISHNLIYRDGVRKLIRYVKDTKTLVRLNCVGLPVDLEGSTLIARAVQENETLEFAALPLGPCDDNPDRQQMLQQLGIGLARHPTIQRFGQANIDLATVREHSLNDLNCSRLVANYPRAEASVFLWFVTAVKPQLESLTFGSQGKPTQEYPSCHGSPPELWPALYYIVNDVYRSLTTVSIAVPRNYGRLVMEMMRALTRCSLIKSLSLLGYASAVLRESQLPAEWSNMSTAAPRWLLEERVKKIKVHWQALYGLLSGLPHLDYFNSIQVGGGGSLKDQPDRTCLLLLQCLEGVAADFAEPSAGGEQRMVANLQKEADVDAFCDVLRILSRTPVLIELNFSDKHMEVVKAQQSRLAAPLSRVPAGENGPIFTHAVVLKNGVISEVLLQSVDYHAQLREFGYERLDAILPALFAALCGREKPLPVERIRVEPYAPWRLEPCYIRKRFSDQKRRWLDSVHRTLLRSDRFIEVQSGAHGTVSRDQIAAMSAAEFAELLTGIQPDDMPEQTKHPPASHWRVFPSYKRYEKLSPDDEPVFVPLPMDDESRDQLALTKLSLCMCNLRARLLQAARPDEYADTCKSLWYGPRRHQLVGSWDEFEPPVDEEEEEDQDQEDQDQRPVRYHWQHRLRIGTRQAYTWAQPPESLETEPSNEPSCAESLLIDGLRSLLPETPTLTSLDLRGNGLTKEDACYLLSLLEQQENLVYLNIIPVTPDEARSCRVLDFNGTGIEKGTTDVNKDDDPYGDDDDDDPPGESYAQDALEADMVRLDEGDGYIFLSVITRDYFPELRSVVLKQHEIPDSTLTHITDALVNLPTIETLHLSDLRLSSRGASLLLSAVAEMAPRLASLNGLPLASLVQLRDSPEGSPLELTGPIEWNDFPLGAMARLNLWSRACFPPAAEDGYVPEFSLQGRGLTDVGLRGLCAMLRHFAGQDRGPASPLPGRGGPLHLTRIDLSGNMQITDATVADLCHTLQHRSMGESLRHGLRDVSVRSCMRLHTRSAYELLNLAQHARDSGRDGSAVLGGCLQTLNGVDLAALQAMGRATAAGGRSGSAPARSQQGAPPMLLRTFVELDRTRHCYKPEFPALSECDVHFFASMLHMFSQIPYCHVHIVIPASKQAEAGGQDANMLWGPPGPFEEEGPFPSASAVSNDSPFPPPEISQETVKAVQGHLDAARRLFEACPISTQLRLSVAPLVPGCEKLIAESEYPVLSTSASGDRSGNSAASGFGRVQQKLQEQVSRQKKKERKAAAAAGGAQRPLYVNNINSQRLHDCFRTLYGHDDVELDHQDIIPPDPRCTVRLPTEVDISQVFGVASSVDMQHMELGAAHLSKLATVTEMAVLTHVNLNYNQLGDVGVNVLFSALANSGCSVMHVAVAANNIGDVGVLSIATYVSQLPRLTSLELCDNFILERGSIALAEAIGGIAGPDADGPPACGPLQMLSVDLKGNRSRELGAMRWAEVICSHPSLQFLCLAQNELGRMSADSFQGLVYAAVASPALSVLDLRDNFPVGPAGKTTTGPPPDEVTEELLADLPSGEFDVAEVRQAVFIRRHRGGGTATAPEKKGRQPQQGTQRHAHSQQMPSSER